MISLKRLPTCKPDDHNRRPSLEWVNSEICNQTANFVTENAQQLNNSMHLTKQLEDIYDKDNETLWVSRKGSSEKNKKKLSDTSKKETQTQTEGPKPF